MRVHHGSFGTQNGGGERNVCQRCLLGKVNRGKPTHSPLRSFFLSAVPSVSSSPDSLHCVGPFQLGKIGRRFRLPRAAQWRNDGPKTSLEKNCRHCVRSVRNPKRRRVPVARRQVPKRVCDDMCCLVFSMSHHDFPLQDAELWEKHAVATEYKLRLAAQVQPCKTAKEPGPLYTNITP